MINYSLSKSQMLFNFEAFSEETIELSPENINQAVELSFKIPNEQRQWRTYLNVLALSAFEEWLSLRAPEFNLNQEDCTILQPAIANVIDAVANLQVGEFKLCLITTSSFTDEEINVPRAVIDLPEFIPHFYVIVEVQEEQEAAVVKSFLSHEQLVNRRANVNLEAEEDWTYQLPLTWFEADPDRLLLFLRCLESTAISLPIISKSSPALLAEIISEVNSKSAQLQSPERHLWQFLTWEQGAIALNNQDLLTWLYQLQCGEISLTTNRTSIQQHLSDLVQLFTQPTVNVGRWLFNELDEFSQELSWVLLPNIVAPAIRETRSPMKEIELISKQLRHKGVEIPKSAHGAYRDLQLAEMPLRLYAVTWSMLTDSQPEWTLLLILGAAPGTSLPSGLGLRVSDQTKILVEQQLDNQTQESYLFTSVIGNWDEKFVATISLEARIEQTLPPFGFNP